MKVAAWMASISGAVFLTSCGGGDDSGPPVAGPVPVPTLAVTLSENSADISIPEAGKAEFGFEATYTGSSSDNVIADIAIGGQRYALKGAPTSSGKTFTVNLETVPFPAGGLSSSEIVFRLCKTAACDTVYPGSTKRFTVNLDVVVRDWGTFQRDIAHTGYVPVRLDPARFDKAWEWTDSFTAGRIRPPAASRGKVLIVTARDGGMAYAGTARLKAFETPSGSEIWSYDMGDQFHASGPSISNELVHVSSMVTSSSSNPQWVFNLASGTFKNQMEFAAQWTNFNQPVADGDDVYVAAGYYGSVIYGYDAGAGTQKWVTDRTGGAVWGGQSIALDDDHAYYYSGAALDQVDRATGKIVKSIADPEYVTTTYDYQTGPVLDGKGSVFLFSGDKSFEGGNKIVAMSLGQGSIKWRSSAQYSTAFALADDTIFAVRQDAHVLSAIDAENGEVLWSAPLPGSDTLLGNVIATENLIFVSSGSQTWAIDRKKQDHAIVWEAPTGGRLAITPDNYLLTTGQRGASRLTAYKLF
ncbi:PQQ-binding-like beta-propeller repeat protein [Qipengyuania sp. GH1]|uniref:outer membrane protein assembly factor BamB family protein n=1 Tax=Qipengyuania aestuarii TaxID=2867241 RepID=UPI001C886DCC|nr:PQQ-binding-like beta-propeller repeat protein [Qipengyuania aestuarii]MBX7535520.1 PQQ-binding-like beta-propeller repeat protein [Qipengyuania aestuarii]